MDFYKKISDLCVQHNIHIKDLERELNFSNGIIGKWKTYSPNIKYLINIADYFNISIEELCYDIDITKDQELLSYFHAADERGKSNITNIAELEARRSRKEKTDEQENKSPSSTTQKIQFPNKEKNLKNELKPFA